MNRRIAIGEVARRAGLSISTLHYYERIGILRPPERISGKRHYTSDVLARLQFIRIAKSAGFSLHDIRALLECPSTRRDLTQSQLDAVRNQIARLEAVEQKLVEASACNCGDIMECTLGYGI